MTAGPSPCMTFAPYLVAAVLGLAFGSFLNVCIFRLPRYESVVAPRSRCPHCGHAIRWYDNVPVAGYLLLGGRCRECRAPISPIYPMVQILPAGGLLAPPAPEGRRGVRRRDAHGNARDVPRNSAALPDHVARVARRQLDRGLPLCGQRALPP